MIFTDLFESRDICRVCGQTPCNCTHIVAEEAQNKDMTGQTCEKCKKGKYQERSQHDDMQGKVTCKCGHRVDRWKKYKEQGVAEGKGNIGASIKALYQKIYNAGDDEIEYFYNDSPIFAQYWDEYEGDLDSIIAEVDPAELQVMHDELESYAQQAGLEEAFIAPALSAANAAAEHLRGGGGYRGRVDVKVGSREEYMSALKTLKNAARQAGQHVEIGRNGSTMSVFSDSLGSDELGQFVDNTLKQGVAEGKWSHNAITGQKLDPRTGEPLPAKEKPLTMKQMFAPKSQPKLTLDDVWHKVELVVSQIYPDGDPIDYLAPWLEKHGIRGFKVGEVLERAAKKNGFKDVYDYWDRMGDDLGYQQGVAEVSDQTLTSYLSKVDADSQKHEKDPTKRSPEKRNKSVSGFARAFNKLDARKEKTDENQMQENDLAQQMLALAKKVSPNARIAGTPEQERERTQQMMAQRAKDRENQPAQQVSDEQRAQLQANLKELEAQFDPNYQYSDDYTFWSRQNAIAQQIGSIRKQLGLTEVSKKTLGDYLHGAHKDVVDRATSSSFQSGQAGDKYNKADVSPKERQREKGMARAVARLTREGSSMAEAWASRYPNINADIAECQSSGDADRLKKLMTIKDIIDSDLREQSGLGFGQ